jgi:hypothetical protein
VLCKAAKKLSCPERHLPLLVSVRVIFPAKGDLFTIEGEETVIADSHPMRVTSEIAKDLGGSAERLFRVNNPFLPEERIHKSVEPLWIPKVSRLASEDQLTLSECFSQSGNEPGSEDQAKCFDRQKKDILRTNPSLMVGRQTT